MFILGFYFAHKLLHLLFSKLGNCYTEISLQGSLNFPDSYLPDSYYLLPISQSATVIFQAMVMCGFAFCREVRTAKMLLCSLFSSCDLVAGGEHGYCLASFLQTVAASISICVILWIWARRSPVCLFSVFFFHGPDSSMQLLVECFRQYWILAISQCLGVTKYIYFSTVLKQNTYLYILSY